MGWCTNRAVTLLFSVCLLANTLVVSQTPDTAVIRGSVWSQNGTPLRGANIVILDSDQRAVRTSQTDAEGTFYAGTLPVASPLIVSANYPGFVPAVSDPVTLLPGVTARILLTLQIAPIHAEVRVTGDIGAVRTDEPQLGDQLTSEQMESVPLLNRRLTWLPLLNAANRPAINQGDIFMNQLLFTANGTGRRQTWFEVDGASGNDLWGRQTIFTNVPVDAISQLTVLDNAFAADYGFGEGAVV